MDEKKKIPAGYLPDLSQRLKEIHDIFKPLKTAGDAWREQLDKWADSEEKFRRQEIEFVRQKISKLNSPASILVFLHQEKIRLQKLIAEAYESRNKRSAEFYKQILDDVIETKFPAYEAELKFEREIKSLLPASLPENVIPSLPGQVIKQSNNPRQITRGKISFVLKSFHSDQTFFVKKNKTISEVIALLKTTEKPFISPETSTSQFQSVLSGEIIKRADRINWTGSLFELSQFVKLLDRGLGLILPLKNDIWLTTAVCFTHQGKDIEPDQVRNANGSKKRIPQLKSILEKLCTQHSAI